MKLDGLFSLIGAFILIILIGLLASLPVWLLWNSCFVGAVDGVRPIGWFQSWGLMIMFQILFKLKVER